MQNRTTELFSTTDYTDYTDSYYAEWAPEIFSDHGLRELHGFLLCRIGHWSYYWNVPKGKLIREIRVIRGHDAECKSKGLAHYQSKSLTLYIRESIYSSTAACAAARRAIGTRKGEQLA